MIAQKKLDVKRKIKISSKKKVITFSLEDILAKHKRYHANFGTVANDFYDCSLERYHRNICRDLICWQLYKICSLTVCFHLKAFLA